MKSFNILLLPLKIFEWFSLSITGTVNAFTSEARENLLDDLESVGREMSHSITIINEVRNDSNTEPNLKERVDTLFIEGINLSKLLVDIHQRLIGNTISPSDYDASNKVIDDAKQWSKTVDSYFNK
jgi:hypothetical protein